MSTQSITYRTRMLLQDTGEPFAATISVDGVSSVFDLPVESISSTAYPPTVVFNGQILSNAATPQYTFDYKHGVIMFPSALTPAGATLAVQGWTYDFFDDNEVAQAVKDAFNLHVADQDPLPVEDPGLGQIGISTNENYLVSILAAIELLWFRATDASQTIDVHTPEGVTIPASERFRQILAQINALQEEYKAMAGALGVGLFRIQVLWQRRVSLTTNRLVPIFREQEYNQPYAGFYPTSAPVGAIITIEGKYFTGTTQVTFGGVPALTSTITVVDDEHVQAIVPVGAKTGQIGIMTPGGEVLTTAQFVVGEAPPFILYGPEQVKPPIPPGT